MFRSVLCVLAFGIGTTGASQASRRVTTGWTRNIELKSTNLYMPPPTQEVWHIPSQQNERTRPRTPRHPVTSQRSNPLLHPNPRTWLGLNKPEQRPKQRAKGPRQVPTHARMHAQLTLCCHCVSLLQVGVADCSMIVQGSSLRTWSSYRSPLLEQVQIILSTEGRPLDADIELWHGPEQDARLRRERPVPPLQRRD